MHQYCPQWVFQTLSNCCILIRQAFASFPCFELKFMILWNPQAICNEAWRHDYVSKSIKSHRKQATTRHTQLCWQALNVRKASSSSKVLLASGRYLNLSRKKTTNILPLQATTTTLIIQSSIRWRYDSHWHFRCHCRKLSDSVRSGWLEYAFQAEWSEKREKWR